MVIYMSPRWWKTAREVFFLLTSTGLFQFDLETEKYYILPVPSPPLLPKERLGVWIAEGGKLFLYDKNTRLLETDVCRGTFAG